MKKLWITGVSLSIFINFQFVVAQDTLVPNVGKGVCWKKEKDARGFEIFTFHTLNDSAKCGYFTAYQIPHSAAGSSVGFSGYVKIVNVNNPNHAFYLGGGPFENQRALKFGKNAKMACYICTLPPTVTNLPSGCSPNDGDPARRALCFGKMDGLNCETQVDCSQVVDITECYQQAQGTISESQPNDLKLCGEQDKGINLGIGSDSELAKSEATSQRGQISGAASGLGA